MKILLTYRRGGGLKIKVIPHWFAPNVVVLLLYRARRFLFFKWWKRVDSIGVDWPERKGILDKQVEEFFNKQSSNEILHSEHRWQP